MVHGGWQRGDKSSRLIRPGAVAVQQEEATRGTLRHVVDDEDSRVGFLKADSHHRGQFATPAPVPRYMDGYCPGRGGCRVAQVAGLHVGGMAWSQGYKPRHCAKGSGEG